MLVTLPARRARDIPDQGRNIVQYAIARAGFDFLHEPAADDHSIRNFRHRLRSLRVANAEAYTNRKFYIRTYSRNFPRNFVEIEVGCTGHAAQRDVIDVTARVSPHLFDARLDGCR